MVSSVALCTAFGVTVVSGCRDLSATLPAGTPNPSVFNNAAGALMKRNAADSIFEGAVLRYAVDAGLLTDELEDRLTGQTFLAGTFQGSLDERILPQFLTNDETNRGGASYRNLQLVRGSTNDAIGALAKYDSAASPALRGEMYAIQGYAEVMLAELFCSGVPLSTLDFQGDFTYRPGSTQQAVYQDAIAKFDTAVALSSDSARILNLARVGLGRAYLDLGDYTHAAAAVASVPDDFRYQVNVQWRTFGSTGNALNELATVSDREGTNGLPFLSGGDPRTAAVVGGIVQVQGLQLYFPKKYSRGLDSTASYYSPITVADGVEARLIQAEAALHAGDPSWLTILNTLRTAGGVTVDTVADTLGVTGCSQITVNCGHDPGNGLGGSTPAFGQPYPGGFVPPAGFTLAGESTTYPAPAGIKTYCYNASWYIPCYQGDSLVVLYYTKLKANPVWSAGVGGVAGLAPLSDPGPSAGDTARVNLVFAERAYWLYLTGHRQGDLRRFVRNYHRDQSTVYPTGIYLAPGQGVYGTDVNVPVPSSETPNPYFHGCLDHDA
jgi:hypothetical protein